MMYMHNPQATFVPVPVPLTPPLTPPVLPQWLLSRAASYQADIATRTARGEPAPDDEKLWLHIFVDNHDKLDHVVKELEKRSIVVISASPEENPLFSDILATVPTSLFIEISEIDGVVRIEDEDTGAIPSGSNRTGNQTFQNPVRQHGVTA